MVVVPCSTPLKTRRVVFVCKAHMYSMQGEDDFHCLTLLSVRFIAVYEINLTNPNPLKPSPVDSQECLGVHLGTPLRPVHSVRQPKSRACGKLYGPGRSPTYILYVWGR